LAGDSAVVIATRYGLHGPGIEARWGPHFPHPSGEVLGPTQPPVKLVPGVFPGLRRAGRGVDHPSPSTTDVKERVQIYFYSPSGTSWNEVAVTFHLATLYMI
jgi:hypothetical protein